VHHLFPGRLTGFRAALIERLERIRGIKAYDNSRGFEVFATVTFEPSRKEFLGKRLAGGGRSKARGQEVESTTTRREVVTVPYEIGGPNRAAATARWHELMAKYVAAVEEFATHRACGHCDGSGIAPASIGAVK
jgi:hypothetical protein